MIIRSSAGALRALSDRPRRIAGCRLLVGSQRRSRPHLWWIMDARSTCSAQRCSGRDAPFIPAGIPIHPESDAAAVGPARRC